LQKGAAIDSVNESGKNCLDIAISRDQKDVIITLLQDKNWQKLIKVNNEIPKQSSNGNDLVIRTTTSSYDTKTQKQSLKREKKIVENQQMWALFEKKSWLIIFIILEIEI
jgi:ankyrin repeat protein